MTPCEKLGYKVGDRFEVTAQRGNVKGCNGSILVLTRDDGSNSPWFSIESATGNISRLSRAEEDGSITFAEIDALTKLPFILQPGDYVLTKGMDEATYHKVAQKFFEAGAKDRWDMCWRRPDGEALGWDSRTGELWHCCFVSSGFSGRHLTVAQVLGEDGADALPEVGAKWMTKVGNNVEVIDHHNGKCVVHFAKQDKLFRYDAVEADYLVPLKTEREKMVEDIIAGMDGCSSDKEVAERLFDLGYRKTGE